MSADKQTPAAYNFFWWIVHMVEKMNVWAMADAQDRAIEKRVRRIASILDNAEIPYAVIGGNAVRAWVQTVDPSAVRATRDVDIIIPEGKLADVIVAAENDGMTFRHAKSVDMLLESPDGKARDAIHVLQGDFEPVRLDGISVVALADLVRMKLDIYRLKDRVHLLDMIETGLIDATWPARFELQLADRLRYLIENPEI